MMKKHEAVFGDQSLFDDCGSFNNIIAIGRNTKTNLCSYFTEEDISNFDIIRHNPIIAMRRIIEVPTWTRADKEIGKFPPVGAECLWVDESGLFGEGRYPAKRTKIKIIAHYENPHTVAVFTWIDEGGVCVNSSSAAIMDFEPIETQEEKAQRLEDEWVNKAYGETAVFADVKQVENERLKTHIRHIYNALLSGELKAPEVSSD